MAVWHVSSTGNDSTGTGSAGSPYATIGKANTVSAGGDTILVATGVVETITTALVPKVGGPGAMTTWLGTDASWNEITDPSLVSNFPTIIMNNTTNYVVDAQTISYFRIRNFLLDGGSGASKAARCFNGGTNNNVGIKNCKVTRFSVYGVVNQTNGGFVSQVWGTAGLTGSIGIYVAQPMVEESAVTGSSGDGFYVDSNSSAVCIIAANNTGNGINLSDASGRNLVAWSNGGDGLKLPWAGGVNSVRNGIFGKNTGYGINSSAVTVTDPDADYNALYSNTTGARSGIPAGAHDQTLTADPFVASSGTIASLVDVFANFALSPSGADFASKLKGKGYPAYLDIGAVQHQDSGGGGSGGVSLARVLGGL